MVDPDPVSDQVADDRLSRFTDLCVHVAGRSSDHLPIRPCVRVRRPSQPPSVPAPEQPEVLVVGLGDASGQLEPLLRVGHRVIISDRWCSEEVVTAVRAAVEGTAFLGEDVAEHVLALAVPGRRAGPQQCPSLTPKEEEVIRFLARGLNNSEIAGALCLSVATVKNHVHRILSKLQCDSRERAVARYFLPGA